MTGDKVSEGPAQQLAFLTHSPAPRLFGPCRSDLALWKTALLLILDGTNLARGASGLSFAANLYTLGELGTQMILGSGQPLAA
jgi:hypothetical protein